MSNKIKAFFNEQTESIQIESDAKKGDHIKIDELTSFDRYIDKEITTKYKTKIINDYKNSNEYKQHQQELELKNQEISKLKIKESELQSQVNAFKDKQTIIEQDAINKFRKSEEYLELQEYKEKTAKLQEKLKQNEELVSRKAIDEFKKSEEYISKKNTIQKLTEQKEILDKQVINLTNELDKSKTEKENALLKQKEQFNDLINKQNDKINELTKDLEYEQKRKKEMSIKRLGEDFEQECFKMYEESLGQNVEDCVFKKAETIDGTKADFIFEVYTHNLDTTNKENPLLGKVVLEMKTEQRDSENKKSNKDHLKKLEKDREKANADIALLVTELEREDNFYIKRDIEYKNIIIVRPEAMISVLSILRVIFLKNKDIVLAELEFKDKQLILEEFESWKEDMLKTSITKINNKMQGIIKSANEIIKKGQDILEDVEIITNSHLNALKNKIEQFSIKKICNKLKD